ncbi:MAG: hypothetical protein Q4B60_09255 [Erysipelotrichaceae bacterium]|nr:hypothetical protein [Erysipelotrichaceae bacterium]
MKKLLILLLTCILLITNGLSVMAVNVPSVQKPADIINPDGDLNSNGQTVDYAKDNAGNQLSSGGLNIIIVLTPYQSRDSIAVSEVKDKLVEARDDIVKGTDYLDVLEEVSTIKHIPKEELAASNVFDITLYIEGTTTIVHNVDYAMKLQAETLKNFVALIHYKDDGSWEIVDNAHIVGEYLHFSFNSASPFAIVTKIVGEGNTSSDRPVVNTSVK